MVPTKFNCVVSHRGTNNTDRVCIFGPTVSNDGGNNHLREVQNMTDQESRCELCFLLNVHYSYCSCMQPVCMSVCPYGHAVVKLYCLPCRFIFQSY